MVATGHKGADIVPGPILYLPTVVTNRGRFKSKRVLFDFDPKILLFENEKALKYYLTPLHSRKGFFRFYFVKFYPEFYFQNLTVPNPDTASFGLKFWPQGPIWSH